MIRNTACLIGRPGDPYRSMAFEAHLCQAAPRDTAILYLWSGPAAISFGRGQDLADDCDLNQARMGCLPFLRRASGGGAFYMDRGTLNYSLVMPRADWNAAMQQQMMADALSHFGIQAFPGPGYGLYAGGERAPVVRSAYYLNAQIGLEHGVIHLRTDAGASSLVLPGSDGAICNLSMFSPSVNTAMVETALCAAMENSYGAKPTFLSERMFDSDSIAREAAAFRDAAWIAMPHVDDERPMTRFFSWGSVRVSMRIANAVIEAVTIRSDAMEAALFLELEKALYGVPCLISAVTARVEQRLEPIQNDYLKQMLRDVGAMVCERIRSE